MDQQLITQKLESLRRCIQRVEDKQPLDLTTLQQDADLQDIVVLNLTRAVQLCVDIATHLLSDTGERAPRAMGDAFTSLAKLGIISEQTETQMRKAVGFRNIAIHNYEEIDWAIVQSICKKQLTDFRAFAKSVTNHCGL